MDSEISKSFLHIQIYIKLSKTIEKMMKKEDTEPQKLKLLSELGEICFKVHWKVKLYF